MLHYFIFHNNHAPSPDQKNKTELSTSIHILLKPTYLRPHTEQNRLKALEIKMLESDMKEEQEGHIQN